MASEPTFSLRPHLFWAEPTQSVLARTDGHDCYTRRTKLQGRSGHERRRAPNNVGRLSNLLIRCERLGPWRHQLNEQWGSRWTLVAGRISKGEPAIPRWHAPDTHRANVNTGRGRSQRK